MASPWSYEGKRVLVSGGGGAGMGAAVVRDLLELGAEVHVFDLKDPPEGAASFQTVDLREPDAIDDAVAKVGGRIDALFNCAGLPGPPFSGTDVMLVNFVAARHLTGVVTSGPMPEGGAVVTISSAAGYGWENVQAQVADLLATPDYASARKWCEDNTERVGEGYVLSKQAINWWTCNAALDLAPRNIRVNSTGPGPTATPMMPSFEEYVGKDFMQRFPKPLGGRYATPEEQAHAIVFLNSDAAAQVTGVNLYVDAGFAAMMVTGRVDWSSI